MSAHLAAQPRDAVQAESMQAIVQARYGTAGDVLRLGTVARPAVRADEVLVRIVAGGVEPGVWHVMSGRPYLVRLMGFGLRRPKMPIRGRALAGRVEQVGVEVTQFRAGDEVMGWGEGTYAEYVATKEQNLVAKPAGLSFEEAAAVPISGETALQAVRDKGEVKAGQHVLVTGAAGGVGSFAVQIAKALGAEVTGMSRTSKLDLVRSIGTDHAIDSGEDVAAGGPRFDVIIDTAGLRSLAALRRALRGDGTLVIVGGEGGGRLLGGFGRNLVAPFVSMFSRQRVRSLLAEERAEDLLALNELIDAGKVRPAIDRVYPLAEVAAAIDHLHSGTVRGKVVIRI